MDGVFLDIASPLVGNVEYRIAPSTRDSPTVKEQADNWGLVPDYL